MLVTIANSAMAAGAVIGLLGIWLLLWDSGNEFAPWLLGGGLGLLLGGSFIMELATRL